MECEFCQALLVDVFASRGDDAKTDPIQVIGGAVDRSTDTDALLRAAQEVNQDDAALDDRAPLQRLPRPFGYTGDLPRLFRFGDRYQILEKVGEGGMGRVYKALDLDLELDRPVALKTIRAEKGNSREALERFKQELILARKITHKNVIHIYDLGESDGMKFFTMELVEGENLREVLDERKKIPVKECLSLMTQILSGLGEAHSQGVVHRDLKPQNIMACVAHVFGDARSKRCAKEPDVFEGLAVETLFDHVRPHAAASGKRHPFEKCVDFRGNAFFDVLLERLPDAFSRQRVDAGIFVEHTEPAARRAHHE